MHPQELLKSRKTNGSMAIVYKRATSKSLKTKLFKPIIYKRAASTTLELGAFEPNNYNSVTSKAQQTKASRSNVNTRVASKAQNISVSKADVHDRVTATIIDALEKNPKPTEWPWIRGANGGIPVNASTGKEYAGINRLLLLDCLAGRREPLLGDIQSMEKNGRERPREIERNAHHILQCDFLR